MGSAEQHNKGRWAGHPRASSAVRIVAWISPIVIAALVTHLIARAVPRPAGLGPALVWFAALTLVATSVLFVVDKVARRLLPLAALLQLSLVFPDRAPSRFEAALRTQTVDQLEARVAEVQRSGLPDDPVRAAETLIELVAALSQHDHITRGHADRVRAYCNMIGQELNLSSEDLEMLTWAGLLHDVGKLFVPGEILNKPSRLTDDEYDVIKTHTALGAELCEPLRGWLGNWVDAVGEHHEKWDGSGYPAGLTGDEICLGARIVAVADVFDVITSTRSYKTANGAVQGREELARCAGSHFDPLVVRAFLNISLGRLRLAMGPLSWIAQLPIVGRIPLSPAAGAATSAAATGAALLATGALSQPIEVDSYQPSAAAEVVEPAAPKPSPKTAADKLPEVAPRATPVARPTTIGYRPPVVPTSRLEAVEPATPEPSATSKPPPPPGPSPTPDVHQPPDVVPTPVPTPHPVAIDDVAMGFEDTPIDIDVAANDTHARSIAGTTPPTAGSVALLSGTLLRYTPPKDWAGYAAFYYTIDDGTGLTDTATVTITVTPTPDPPAAADDTATVDEDNTLTGITVLTNDSDPDGDPLTITNATTTEGTATTDGTTLTYTPTPDSNGTHTIDYTIDDGTGLTDTATVTITVTPTPDPPTAADDTATVDEDNTLTGITVLTNDSDPDGDPLTITNATTTEGTATTDGTTLTYTPTPDSNGTHTIDYTIDDGTGLTDTATVTITVTPTPDPPTAADDAYTAVGGGALVTGLPGVLANDGDEDGDTLTATASTPPTNGSVTLAADGSFVYTPNPLFTGTDSFEYTVGDGTGLTDTATVTVTVGGSPSQTSLFLGTSGASASDWDLTTSPPGSADPEPDHDGDADEGLTIKKGDEKLGNTDPEEFQHWSLTTPSDLVLNGPVSMRLWSTVGGFEADKAVDYSIWVRDCAADGTDCSTIASAVNVHVGSWNDRAGDWVTRDIVVGSVEHTIAAGRMLRVRLMFDHRDVWVALSGSRPSQLLVTQ